MKLLLCFVALFAMVNGDCDTCDTSPYRDWRVGCRLFCFFDVSRDGVLTQEDAVQVWEDHKDSAEGVTKETFIPILEEALNICKNEAEAGYDLIVSLGGNDESIIELGDIEALVGLLRAATGSNGGIPQDTYAEFFPLLYDIIADPNCPIGA